MNVEVLDSRRLTGPNLHWDHPSAIIEAAVDGDPAPLVEAWRRAVSVLLEGTGHSGEKTAVRLWDGGVSLLISAAIDALYAMCDLNESALTIASDPSGSESIERAVARLREAFAEEANPDLIRLQAEAVERNVPFLWDDDEVSLGFGPGSRSWPAESLPDPATLDWPSFTRIPLGLVTGTNGKSTTVRMTAAIVAASGKRAGLTSTDYIRVAGRTLDSGDYSGTGGARMLLRQRDVDAAILEVARGGMLRRGLGVDRADAAVITNVAADHLGDYGIHTVPELIEVKFIVRRALGPAAPLILNADDEGIVAFAQRLDQPLWWFSLDSGNELIQSARRDSRPAFWLEDGALVGGTAAEVLARLEQVPATMGGLARHNVANALAAAALATALGIGPAEIGRGLEEFAGDESDNPGRANLWDSDGVRILLDFAHNEHGMKALSAMVSGMQPRRVWLLMGQAGDRLDEDIAALTRAALEMNPDHLAICDLPGYERGREPGVVSALIRSVAQQSGMSEGRISLYPEPVAAVKEALAAAVSGDLLVFLALTQREQVLQMIHQFVDR